MACTFAMRLIVCGRQQVRDAAPRNVGISEDRWDVIVSQLLVLSHMRKET